MGLYEDPYKDLFLLGEIQDVALFPLLDIDLPFFLHSFLLLLDQQVVSFAQEEYQEESLFDIAFLLLWAFHLVIYVEIE